MVVNKVLFSSGFWVKLVIVVGVGFVFMQKDINFQVHFQSPLKKTSSQKISVDKNSKESSDELSEKQSKGPSMKSMAASIYGASKKRVKSEPVRAQPRLKDISKDKIDAYVDRFSGVAMSEMRKFGIPASIILANGLLQSAAGETNLAQNANNYFNLPCQGNWNGMMQDYGGKCYRKYESAWAGFRGHSQYIYQNFKHLKKYEQKDYPSWANGLEKGKFGTEKKISKKLISIIEKYDLGRFDKK